MKRNTCRYQTMKERLNSQCQTENAQCIEILTTYDTAKKLEHLIDFLHGATDSSGEERIAAINERLLKMLTNSLT